MTEAEWLATEPIPMLEFLKGKASDRKLRLFAAACCRDVWDVIVAMEEAAVGYGCVAVQLGEQLADGRATPEAVLAAIEDRVGMIDSGGGPYGHLLYTALPGLADSDALRGATRAAKATGIARGRLVRYRSGFACGEGSNPSEASQAEGLAAMVATYALQSKVVRCIFGNPFRPVTLDPSWLTSTVLALANGIYSDRAFDRMPILADALQDADCDNEDILNHCRQPSEHTRGCWVLDACLGKQ